MSKRHEEEWSTGEGVLSGALYAGDTWIGSFTNPERARLAKEAPRLAMMLLETGGLKEREWHTNDCFEYGHGEACDEVRAVLKAAGVIE